jgi:hypothetical protein
MVGAGKRQGSQQNRIGDAVDGCRCADTDPEREDRDRREAGGSPQRPDGVAQVSIEIGQPPGQKLSLVFS